MQNKYCSGLRGFTRPPSPRAVASGGQYLFARRFWHFPWKGGKTEKEKEKNEFCSQVKWFGEFFFKCRNDVQTK